MHRIVITGSLLALLLASLIGTFIPASATTPINDYERKLKQVAKANRSFQLPNALILNQILSGLGPGMEYFLEKSGLLNKIADRCLLESGIYIAVELAYYDYNKYVKHNMPPSMPEMALMPKEMKPHLIDVIIKASKETDIKNCNVWGEK
ncbi:MAG: hypothetical protein BGO67_03815 [Alphaproteobacteria bacterium 41-28]|nr:MAG: hypothetical protein BGO67_03815 [Alphaproteobacteria bacterium 41-28]